MIRYKFMDYDRLHEMAETIFRMLMVRMRVSTRHWLWRAE